MDGTCLPICHQVLFREARPVSCPHQFSLACVAAGEPARALIWPRQEMFFDVIRCPWSFVVGRAERCRDAYCRKVSVSKKESAAFRLEVKQGVSDICPFHFCLLLVVARPIKPTSCLQAHTSEKAERQSSFQCLPNLKRMSNTGFQGLYTSFFLGRNGRMNVATLELRRARQYDSISKLRNS